MKRFSLFLIAAALLTFTVACKHIENVGNITFAATITDIDGEGILVQTSAEVGFEEALIHLAEGYQPDFTLLKGQTVYMEILPKLTRSIPPQATAVSVKLIAESVDTGVTTVTDGLDPMPMLTPGEDAGVEAPDTAEAHMADMLPIFDSIVRIMGIEGEQKFTPDDATFVWSVLRYLGENWAQTSKDTSMEGDKILVPENVMKEWMLAAFGEEVTPALPETFKESIRIDAAHGVYLLKKAAVDNDSATQIDKISDLGNGTYDATVGLYTDRGERLGGVVFQLKDVAEENGVFCYCITDATAEK